MVFGGRIETEILDVRRSPGFATGRCEASVVCSPLWTVNMIEILGGYPSRL